MEFGGSLPHSHSPPPVPTLAKLIHCSAHHTFTGAACFLPGRAKDLSAPRYSCVAVCRHQIVQVKKKAS